MVLKELGVGHLQLVMVVPEEENEEEEEEEEADEQWHIYGTNTA